MSTLLVRSSFRHLRRHPALMLLSIIGIALGVAVVVSIDLANGSALRAFSLSAQGITGKATHQLLGGPSGLDDSLYVRLRRELGPVAAAPIVEGFVTSPLEPGRAFRLLGVDPFAEAPFRSYVAADASQGLREFLSSPGAAFVSAATADRLGVATGAAWPIAIEGVPKQIVAVARIEAPAGTPARALDDVLITDIATAQELLGYSGKLSRVDLLVPDSTDLAELAAHVRDLCGGRCELRRAAARSLMTTQMGRAFSLNLSALSLLALVVGIFLVYNTMTFAVVQRRPLIGTLRCLGVTRSEVFGFVVREALVLAVPATAFGIALGVLLATELVHLVTRTINDLYFVVNVREVSLDVQTIAKGVVLGLGATLLAALAPAWEATRVPPSITLRRSSSEAALARNAGRLAFGGVALAALATALLAWPGKNLLVSYMGLFGVLLAAALATPAATRAFALAARPVAARIFGVVGRMAARGIVASLTRTSIALAALMIAVATTVGVGIMVHSFRRTVADWLAASLESDIFVQPPSLISRKGDSTLLPSVVERVASTEGVSSINTIRNRRIRTLDGEIDLHVPVLNRPSSRVYRFQKQESGDVMQKLEREQTVAITEPYAFHHDLGVGSKLEIMTDRGHESFRIIGIYADYASDEGGVLMSRNVYERHFEDRRISAMALVAEPGVDLAALSEKVRQRAGTEQALHIRLNRELREASLSIFDRTFAITQVLRLLSMGVAFVGILSALMALALERARELAILRAVGLLPRQLVQLVTLQTSLMGLCAGLLSIPLGIALAFILVFVINRRSFGWTLELALPAHVMIEAIALSLLAALLAGIYPSWKMARAHPAAALRED